MPYQRNLSTIMDLMDLEIRPNMPPQEVVSMKTAPMALKDKEMAIRIRAHLQYPRNRAQGQGPQSNSEFRRGMPALIIQIPQLDQQQRSGRVGLEGASAKQTDNGKWKMVC
jgi:hypothetical protein